MPHVFVDQFVASIGFLFLDAVSDDVRNPRVQLLLLLVGELAVARNNFEHPSLVERIHEYVAPALPKRELSDVLVDLRGERVQEAEKDSAAHRVHWLEDVLPLADQRIFRDVLVLQLQNLLELKERSGLEGL